VWFITGASRGFGIGITRQALGRGDQVVATARHPEALTQAVPDAGDALLALPLDVTSVGQAAAGHWSRRRRGPANDRGKKAGNRLLNFRERKIFGIMALPDRTVRHKTISGINFR
jgi:NAD(P)-dependent dehydrogenase (short-subunit alcohol dehydrogenase family)